MRTLVVQSFLVTHEILVDPSPPTDGGRLTISENLKKFEGPELNCRGSTPRDELVLNEIPNNVTQCICNFPQFYPWADPQGL